MKSPGFSLIEVLVVIAVMGIIMAIAIPNYNDNISKAKIEKQTRELHSIITNARLTAMQTKQPGAIFLGPNQIQYRAYTSLNYPVSLGFKSLYSLTVPYTLKQKMTGVTLNVLDVATDNITFDTRGFTENNMTLVVTPLKYKGGDDCIVVSMSRTNIGRMENASTCTAR